jgi:hypothetical protein
MLNFIPVVSRPKLRKWFEQALVHNKLGSVNVNFNFSGPVALEKKIQ